MSHDTEIIDWPAYAADNYRLTADTACVLCGSTSDPTDEDVIPKWLLSAFDVQPGTTTVNVAEEGGDKHEICKLKRFQVPV
jgi:hypothetical protein